MTRDHMLGYPPATREDFQAPCWWESEATAYGLGVPIGRQDTCGPCEPTPVRRVVHDHEARLTAGDLRGLGYDPSPCHDGPGEPATLSPASMWPFGEAGGALKRAEHEMVLLTVQACGQEQAEDACRAAHERHRLQCLKAMEVRQRQRKAVPL